MPRKPKDKEKKDKRRKMSPVTAAFVPPVSIAAASPHSSPVPDMTFTPRAGTSTADGLSSRFLGQTFTSHPGPEAGEARHIAAALVPAAVFTAVPRTPPPPAQPPDIEPGLSSALLSASLVGQMFATPQPPSDERVLSDVISDTSFDDYGNPPGYSSMDFRGTSTGEGSMLYRGPVPLALDHSYDSDDGPTPRAGSPEYAMIDVHQRRPRSASPVADIIYTEGRRQGRGRKSRRDEDVRVSGEHLMSSTLRRDDEGERSVHSTGQSSKRSPGRHHTRSPFPSPHSTARSHSSHHTLLDSRELLTRTRDLSHTSSLKLRTLEQRNMEMFAQQQATLLKLEEQQARQTALMEKLAEKSLLASRKPDESIRDADMGSLLQETHSVTEATMNQQTSLIQSMQGRTHVLEQEKQELKDLNEQLQVEIDSLRRLASIKDQDGDGSGTQALLLKKRLQDYKDECDTLKSATHRLNSELSRYQAKYRLPAPGEDAETPGLPMKGPTPFWLISSKYLAPLFLAYDDRISEKDNIIRDYEDEMDHFRERIEEIVKENTRLHLRLEQTDITGPISMTEWRQLQEQCKLVLEENQLLMEQLDLQQNKGKDMHKAHVQEVARLAKKLALTESEKLELERKFNDIKGSFQDIKKEHESALIEGSVRMGLEDHLTAINKLKQTLEDERNKYTGQIGILKSEVASLEAERKGTTIEMEDLRNENKQLTSEIKTVNKSQRKSVRKLVILKSALEEIEVKEMSTSKYLNTVIKVAEKTAQERDSLAQMAEQKDRLRKKAVNKVLQESMATARMEEKLKLVKLKANEKLAKAVGRLKELEDDFKDQKSEYDREIKHLRLLLREREDAFESIAGEKRCVEDDLETIWQVATADNKRMRETYRKSVRKLKEHATLDAIISDTEEEKRNLLNLSNSSDK